MLIVTMTEIDVACSYEWESERIVLRVPVRVCKIFQLLGVNRGGNFTGLFESPSPPEWNIGR